MEDEKNCIIVSECEILLLSIMRENVDGEFIAFDDALMRTMIRRFFCAFVFV